MNVLKSQHAVYGQTGGQQCDEYLCPQENNTGAEKDSSSEPEEESSSEDEAQVSQGGAS